MFVLLTIMLFVSMMLMSYSAWMAGKAAFRIYLSKRLNNRLKMICLASKSDSISAEARIKMQGQVLAFRFVMDCTMEDARKDFMYRLAERASAKKK